MQITLKKGDDTVLNQVILYEEFKELCLEYGRNIRGGKKVNFTEDDLKNPQNAEKFKGLYAIVKGHNVTKAEFRSILSGAIKKGRHFGVTDRDAYLVQGSNGFISNNIVQLISNYFDDANRSAFKHFDDICLRFKRSALQDESGKGIKETNKLIKLITDWVQAKTEESDRSMIAMTEDRLKQIEKFAKVYEIIANELQSIRKRERKDVKEGEFSDLASHILGDRWMSCETDSYLFKLNERDLKGFIDKVKNNPDLKERFEAKDIAILFKKSNSIMHKLTKEKYETIQEAFNEYKNTLLSQVRATNNEGGQGESIKLSDATCKDFVKRLNSIFLRSNATIKQNFAFMSGKSIMETARLSRTDKYDDQNPTSHKKSQSRIDKERYLSVYFPNLRLTEIDAKLSYDRFIIGKSSIFNSISLANIYDTAVALTNEFYELSDDLSGKTPDKTKSIAQKKEELKERFVNIDEMFTGYNIIDLADMYTSVFSESGEKRQWLHENMQFLNKLMQPKYIQSIVKYNFLTLIKEPDQLKAEIKTIIDKAKAENPQNADEVINKKLNEYFNLAQSLNKKSTDNISITTSKRSSNRSNRTSENRVKIVTRSMDRENARRARVAILREEIENTMRTIKEMMGRNETANIKIGLLRIKKLAKELKSLDPEFVENFVNNELLALSISIEDTTARLQTGVAEALKTEEESYKSEMESRKGQKIAEADTKYKTAQKSKKVEGSLDERLSENDEIKTLLEEYLRCHPEVLEVIKRAKEGEENAIRCAEELKAKIKALRDKRLSSKDKKEALLENIRSAKYLKEYVFKLGVEIENAEESIK